MGRKKTKDVEVLEEKEVKEVEQEEVKTEEKTIEVNDEVTALKTEKKKRFFDEVKSFFIILIIIGLVALGFWAFYKYAEPIEWNKRKTENENKVINSETYNVATYNVGEGGTLRILGNEYLLEYQDSNLVKIMDRNTNVLYEVVDEEYHVLYVGVDGNLYAVEFLDSENDWNKMNLYVLENEKMVLEKEFIAENTYYNFLLNDGNLVGVIGNSEYINDEGLDVIENTIYTIDDNEYILNDYDISGDETRLSVDSDYFTNNKDYLIIRDGENGTYKYGLYDLKNGEVVINPTYEGIYTSFDGNYVAIKDGKAGIINKKLKKLVDFEYDFIAIQEDYYIVSKNNKLAIMDSKFNLVTGFDFDYQESDLKLKYNYNLCCSSFNTFESYKVNDKYVLTINNEEVNRNLKYDKSETYIIDSNGKYTTIKGNYFYASDEYAYAYIAKDKEIVFYDSMTFEKTNTLDFAGYDYDYMPDISLINGNTIVANLNSELYYSLETLEEITSPLEVTYDVIGTELKYDIDSNTIIVVADSKEVATYEYEATNESLPYEMIDDNSYYYNNGISYVMVEKR